MHVATRRLITASEGLDPASRALLNIWIHQGLDDAAIARLSGMSPARLDERRWKIVAQLASTLGAPPEDVREAIARLAEPDDEPQADEAALANGEVTNSGASGVAEGPAAGSLGAVAAEGNSEPRAEPEILTWKPASRNPRLRVGIAILGLVAVVAVTVAAASSSGGPSPAPVTAGAAASSPTASIPPASTARAPAAPAAPRALTAVPGGPTGAGGTIAVSGTPPHVVLRISVTGLPATGTGHYELWLYSSIIDSVPLGRLSATGARLAVALPADYRHYRYFDVSLQPAGDNPNHSGQSVLRARTGPGG